MGSSPVRRLTFSFVQLEHINVGAMFGSSVAFDMARVTRRWCHGPAATKSIRHGRMRRMCRMYRSFKLQRWYTPSEGSEVFQNECEAQVLSTTILYGVHVRAGSGGLVGCTDCGIRGRPCGEKASAAS